MTTRIPKHLNIASITVSSVRQSTGVRRRELEWSMGMRVKPGQSVESIAEAAAQRWFDDTDQSGSASVTFSVMLGDGRVSCVTVRMRVIVHARAVRRFSPRGKRK